jgi:glutathione S-transferase
MKLYGHPWSIHTRKALMTIAEKGARVPLTLVMLPKGEHKQPEFLRMHPFGKVPVLDDEGYVLYETRAINAYLDARLEGPALTPLDAKTRARMEQWIHVANAYFTPLAGPMLVELLFRKYLGGDQNRAAIDQGRKGIGATFDVLDKHLSTAPYLAGDSLTLADIYWLPYLDYLVAIGEGAPIEERKHMHAWAKKLLERATWREIAHTGPQPYDGATQDTIEKMYRSA